VVVDDEPDGATSASRDLTGKFAASTRRDGLPGQSKLANRCHTGNCSAASNEEGSRGRRGARRPTRDSETNLARARRSQSRREHG